MCTKKRSSIIAILLTATSLLMLFCCQAVADEVMHEYLGNYPSERETGWSEEVQGIAHNSRSWFITQQNKLWKFPVEHDLNRVVDGPDPANGILSVGIPDPLRSEGYDHFGDLHCYRGIVIVPVSGASPSIVALFKTSTLEYLGYLELTGQGKTGWCTVSPNDSLLYSSGSSIDANHFLISYRVKWDFVGSGLLPESPGTANPYGTMVARLSVVNRYQLRSQTGNLVELDHMQGGVFSPANHLYLANGYPGEPASRGGISVFAFDGEHWIIIDRSTNGEGSFNFEFDPAIGWAEEPEGLAFWDLDNGPAPNISGQLHALLLDNDLIADDVYLKHYRVSVYDSFTHDTFPETGAWSFRNFSTPELTWDTFEAAFDLSWYDYLNPFTYAFFAAGSWTLADGGNCFGMDLLAIAGEGLGAVSTEFMRMLREPFWDNYPPPPTASLKMDINTYHWRQWSFGFIQNWLIGAQEQETRMAERIDADIRRGKYGVLSITRGFGGHVLVPIDVKREGSRYKIRVYDPNRPYSGSGDYGRYFVTVGPGETWSYPELDDYNQENGNASYVPYNSSIGFYENLGNMFAFIFSEGTTVRQMVDGEGRKLYKARSPTSLMDVDLSQRGLGRSIVRAIPFSQIRQQRPQPQRLTDPSSATVNKMLQRYGNRYGHASEVYFVVDPQLRNLTIQVAGPRDGGDVSLMIGDRKRFCEVRLIGDGRQPVNADVRIRDLSKLASGVALRGATGDELRGEISFGAVDTKSRQFRIQAAKDLRFADDPVRVQLSPENQMRVRSQRRIDETPIERQVIDAKGPRSLGVRRVPLQRRINN